MYGDFTRWSFDITNNDRGILHQQGRVLLDTDTNAQTIFTEGWQEESGRAAFGARVAAVAAHLRDSFKITAAEILNPGQRMMISLLPGQVWADGLLVHQEGAPNQPVIRRAEWAGQPPANPGAAGTRDAVVLEVWRETVSAYQRPAELLEPALGGPDTTERLALGTRLTLHRLQPGEDCEDLAAALANQPKGTLTVTLDPPQNINLICPMEIGGGYTGFEHELFRVEIAANDVPGRWIKYSRSNGGLVGRGTFDAVTNRITLDKNRSAILSEKKQSWYLEVLELDAQRGYWRPTFGAQVTLDPNFDLQIGAIFLGAVPAGDHFFRLWDDILPLANFPLAGGPLADGARLAFDTANPLEPGDFWTFPVRAQFANPQVLLNAAPPQGVKRHRVPLGVLNWTGVSPIPPQQIEDCRRVFPPLTRLAHCCYVRVGDGRHSFGDVTSIQDAFALLPPEGGKICILPGEYRQRFTVEDEQNIVIEGCGTFTRIIAPEAANAAQAQPVVTIRRSNNIKITGLSIEAHQEGMGVLVEDNLRSTCRRIELSDLEITAGRQSGIEVQGVEQLKIQRCTVSMRDLAGTRPAVLVRGHAVLIERNSLKVIEGRGPDHEIVRAHEGLGGLWIRGGSRRVHIVENEISGGIGNGITLGDAREIRPDGVIIDFPGWIYGHRDPCAPCAPGTVVVVDPADPGEPRPPRYEAGPPIEDLIIERNVIEKMGLSGIGVFMFFPDDRRGGVILVDRLAIIGNRITECVRRSLQQVELTMLWRMGIGAITLAAVSSARIWDNVIAGNGFSLRDAVCGIYINLGEAVDISRNHIVWNGGRSDGPIFETAIGARAGIWVQYAVAPTIGDVSILELRTFGAFALRVHENIVHTSVGQALAVLAFGPVSVVGNNFVSELVAPRFHSSLILDDEGAAIMVVNLSRNHDVDPNFKFFGGRVPSRVIHGAMSFQPVYEMMGSSSSALRREPSGGDEEDLEARDVLMTETVSGLSYNTRARGLAESVNALKRRIGWNGNILFTNNQVVVDEPFLPGRGVKVLLAGGDDVAIDGNQFDLMALPGNIDDFNRSTTHLGAIGASVRVVNNRFSETGSSVMFSAITVGAVVNTTSLNQARHCIFAHVNGTWPNNTWPRLHRGGNLFLDPYVALWCGRFNARFENRSEKYPGSIYKEKKVIFRFRDEE